MKVLLLNPDAPETFWSHTHALRILGRKALVPPLGLLTVAAMLPPSWQKRLVDMNVRPLTEADIGWCDCVFVTGMAVQRRTAREAIARCKAAGKTIVAGGPLFLNEHALFEQVDHFVLNEAEITLPKFLADFEAGCAKRMYRTREFADMAQSPVPQWDLVDVRDYQSLSVQYSRGCPFDCDFCNVTKVLGATPASRPASRSRENSTPSAGPDGAGMCFLSMTT